MFALKDYTCSWQQVDERYIFFWRFRQLRWFYQWKFWGVHHTHKIKLKGKSALTSFRISLNCFCCHHLACWFTAAFQKCYFTMGAGGNQPAKFLSGLMNYKTRAKSINLHTLQLELAKWTAQQFGRRDPGCTQLTGQLPLLFTSAIKFAHRFCHAQTFSKLGLLERHVQYFGDLIEPREKSKILETALRTLQDPFKSTMIGTLFIFQTLLATMNPFIHIGKS